MRGVGGWAALGADQHTYDASVANAPAGLEQRCRPPFSTSKPPLPTRSRSISPSAGAPARRSRARHDTTLEPHHHHARFAVAEIVVLTALDVEPQRAVEGDGWR